MTPKENEQNGALWNRSSVRDVAANVATLPDPIQAGYPRMPRTFWGHDRIKPNAEQTLRLGKGSMSVRDRASN